MVRATLTGAGPGPLVAALKAELVRAANPAKAPGMRAYLKAQLPCHGVNVPTLVGIGRTVFPQHELTTAATWRAAIAAVWDQATHVEERALAIILAAHRPYQRFVSLAVLPLYRRMIVEGAWWDTVDALAHRVATLLERYPVPMRKNLRAWARQPNIWLRRVSVIAQVGAKGDTDLSLLYDCIRPSLDSKEFFLRKAIGWALREYAKTDPTEVRRYLREEKHRLSGLSQREALKGIAYVKRHGRRR